MFSSLETLYNFSGTTSESDTLGNLRKEKCSAVGLCSILPEDAVLRCAHRPERLIRDFLPEMIPSNQTLFASAKAGVPKILTELDGLVDESVAVAEVGGLRITQVNAEALCGAGWVVNVKNWGNHKTKGYHTILWRGRNLPQIGRAHV